MRLHLRRWVEQLCQGGLSRQGAHLPLRVRLGSDEPNVPVWWADARRGALGWRAEIQGAREKQNTLPFYYSVWCTDVWCTDVSHTKRMRHPTPCSKMFTPLLQHHRDQQISLVLLHSLLAYHYYHKLSTLFFTCILSHLPPYAPAGHQTALPRLIALISVISLPPQGLPQRTCPCTAADSGITP